MAQRARKGLANWLTSSSTPIFILDQRGVVLVFNQGCEAFTGWSASEVIGKTCSPITTPDPHLIESLTGVLAPPQRVFQGEFASLPAVISTRFGNQTVELSYFPLPQAEEESPTRILGLIGPLKDSGIELVPVSNIRRFNLGKLLSSLYDKHQTNSLIAQSPLMLQIATQLEVATTHSHPIHFQGEVGVGKEYLARTIHAASSLGEKRFLPLDCQRLSHFELARTLRRLFAEPLHETLVGTVYLKQVESFPKDLQIELMGHLARSSPFRWMSSSLAGIGSLSEETFDPELLSLLTAFEIHVPALRHRQQDRLLLAMYFLELFNKQSGKTVEGFSEEVEAEFLTYQWPGNAAELESVIAGSVRRCESSLIQMIDLTLPFKAGRDAQEIRPSQVQESLESYLTRIECERIIEVLQSTRWNKSSAAEILQMPRAKLYRRMAALQISDNPDHADDANS